MDPDEDPDPSDSVFPLLNWLDREDGSVEITIRPPPGRRLALASVGFAGQATLIVRGVVAAPADAAPVVRLHPS